MATRVIPIGDYQTAMSSPRGPIDESLRPADLVFHLVKWHKMLIVCPNKLSHISICETAGAMPFEARSSWRDVQAAQAAPDQRAGRISFRTASISGRQAWAGGL